MKKRSSLAATAVSIFAWTASLGGIGISGIVLGGMESASAQTPLTQAVVSSLRNRVQLLSKGQATRQARLSDVMRPGDGLSTARASLAELRFNDGSLARMGERAVFWFVPQTRTFKLSNGTVLLLITPGQGRTQVRTPNVTAGIQGSALFMRHDQATETTVVGALTNSNIEVSNSDGSQRQVLKAGQMAVVVGGVIRQVYDFDLETFYRTSALTEGLDLDRPFEPQEDPQGTPMAQVRSETLEGLKSQGSFSAVGAVDNPSFLPLTAAQPDGSAAGLSVSPGDPTPDEILPFPGSVSGIGRAVGSDDGPGSGSAPPVVSPVVPSVAPPVAAPVIAAPVADPVPVLPASVPAIAPVDTRPNPVNDLPQPINALPIVADPPAAPAPAPLNPLPLTAADPPAVTPPVTAPPAVTPPVVTPPAVTPPAVTPPAVTPPAVTPPAVTPPAVTPPVVTPPAQDPPFTGKDGSNGVVLDKPST